MAVPSGIVQAKSKKQATDTSGRQEALEEILTSSVQEAQKPVTEKPQVKARYHRDFQYSNDVVLSGIFGTNSYYSQVPDYWKTSYVYAGVQVRLSQMIQDVPASLTFMVNNVPVTTYQMDYRNGKEQILYVEIPVDMLKEGYNSFDITGYVRIYDEEGCIDDLSGQTGSVSAKTLIFSAVTA